MLPENRIPTHPGEVLLEEFLVPMDVSQVAFAAHIGVPIQLVNEIVRGKAGNFSRNRLAVCRGAWHLS